MRDGAGAPSRPETPAALLGDLGGRPLAEGRLGRLQARGLNLAERLTTSGSVGPWAETGRHVLRRDQAIAGSVTASALAYRPFIWSVVSTALNAVLQDDRRAAAPLLGSVRARPPVEPLLPQREEHVDDYRVRLSRKRLTIG